MIVDKIFTRDYEFSVPSAASAVVLGRTSNGKADWKTRTGVSAKDVQIGRIEKENHKCHSERSEES